MGDREICQSRDGEEVHLLDYIIVLAKHSRKIIFTSAAVSAITLVILLFTSNKYTATARLLPPQQNVTLSSQILESLAVSSTPGGSGGGGLGGMAASLLGLKSPSELYVGMLKGNTISDRIIEKFDLKKLYKQRFIETTRKMLSSRSDIKAGKDGLIHIEVTDEDPARAAAMANAFGEELDRLQQDIARRDAQSQLAFLEQERKETSLRLTRAEEALRNFSEKSSVIQIDAQAKGMIEYIAHLRAAIDAKEIQLQVLRQQLTPSNYDLMRLETELKGLKEKLKMAEVQTDQDCIGDVCIAAGKMPTLGLEYFRLYREVKYRDALYQLFSKMVEVARIDAARNAMVNTVLFVDQAKPPELKSKPKRLTTAILAGLATFFVMVLLAFWKEFWHNSITSAAGSYRLRELSNYLEPWQRIVQKISSMLRFKRN